MPTIASEEAEAKLSEAREQVSAVRVAIDAFFSTRPYELCRSPKSDSSIDVLSYRVTRSIAPAIAVRVGNVLHNLHSALDYTACAAARLHSGSDRDIYFPFRSSSDDLLDYLAKLANRLPQSFLSSVAALSPFAGGNELLWQLHLMNRHDKHRRLVPVLEATSHLHATELIVEKGCVLSLGPRGGQHLQRDYAGNLSQTIPTQQPVLNVGQGQAYIVFHQNHGNSARLGFDPYEALTVTPGTVFKTDLNPTFIVTFANAFPDRSVVDVLEQMCHETSRALALL